MTQYILDTNHFTAYQQLHPIVTAKIQSIERSNLALTSVTLQEQAKGWLKAIKLASDGPVNQRPQRLTGAHRSLRISFQLMHQFQILELSTAAYDRFLSLRRQGIRISTPDLQIASISIEVGSIVATQNLRDFEQVPGLVIEDWFKLS
jgi:tRNA(fMet)-specific endonuclease VapC